LVATVTVLAGSPDAVATPVLWLQAQSGAAQSAPPPEVLDQLLAPVALYPDALLAQMLLSAADPGRVVQLGVWLRSNAKLKGSELQDAAQKAGFEPSYVALAPFPQVVEQMAEDTKWTGQVGRAFAADREAVFGSIQRLRSRSKSVGNLKSTPQQTVETKTTEAGQQVIVIEPANPQVVYVPQYNPQVVYTQPASTTVVVHEEDNDDEAIAAGLIGFTAGIAIGAAINNNYYYGPYGWHGGGYMYNDAWEDYYEDRADAREDWYENREDTREDWQDHREDMAGERSDRASNAQEQRTERQQSRGTSTTSTDAQAQREQRRTDKQGASQQARGTNASQQTGSTGTSQPSRGTGAAQQARSTDAQAARSSTASTQSRSSGISSYESRGKTGERSGATAERSGTRSDAFSGYSSGRSTRSESSRGQRSRSSSGGGRSRR
jgi:hypothetical protein